MDNNDIVYEFRLLAKKLQEDDRIVYLEQARRMNDMDQELQDLIGQFNLCQLNYRAEISKDQPDQEKLNKLNDELNRVYTEIMANDSMASYTECKAEADKLTNLIQAIINAAVNGGDPMIVQIPEGGCSGNCAACEGCRGI